MKHYLSTKQKPRFKSWKLPSLWNCCLFFFARMHQTCITNSFHYNGVKEPSHLMHKMIYNLVSSFSRLLNIDCLVHFWEFLFPVISCCLDAVLLKCIILHVWHLFYNQSKFFWKFLLLHSTQAKIPDIEKCLDIVATLQSKKDSSEVCPSAICFSY